MTKENIYNKQLPSIDKFYSSLKLQNISQKQYDKIIKIYKKLGCKNVRDIGMSSTFKIFANSLFGVMMTRVERFKNYKIVTNEKQVDKQTIKPNFVSRNSVNDNLAILGMEKLSVVYNLF